MNPLVSQMLDDMLVRVVRLTSGLKKHQRYKTRKLVTPEGTILAFCKRPMPYVHVEKGISSIHVFSFKSNAIAPFLRSLSELHSWPWVAFFMSMFDISLRLDIDSVFVFRFVMRCWLDDYLVSFFGRYEGDYKCCCYTDIYYCFLVMISSLVKSFIDASHASVPSLHLFPQDVADSRIFCFETYYDGMRNPSNMDFARSACLASSPEIRSQYAQIYRLYGRDGLSLVPSSLPYLNGKVYTKVPRNQFSNPSAPVFVTSVYGALSTNSCRPSSIMRVLNAHGATVWGMPKLDGDYWNLHFHSYDISDNQEVCVHGNIYSKCPLDLPLARVDSDLEEEHCCHKASHLWDCRMCDPTPPSSNAGSGSQSSLWDGRASAGGEEHYLEGKE